MKGKVRITVVVYAFACFSLWVLSIISFTTLHCIYIKTYSASMSKERDKGKLWGQSAAWKKSLTKQFLYLYLKDTDSKNANIALPFPCLNIFSPDHSSIDYLNISRWQPRLVHFTLRHEVCSTVMKRKYSRSLKNEWIKYYRSVTKI